MCFWHSIHLICYMLLFCLVFLVGLSDDSDSDSDDSTKSARKKMKKSGGGSLMMSSLGNASLAGRNVGEV